MLVSALMILYQYFKLMSKSLTDLEDPLPDETLSSATIKAVNYAMLAASKRLKNHLSTTIFVIIWIRQTRQF